MNVPLLVVLALLGGTEPKSTPPAQPSPQDQPAPKPEEPAAGTFKPRGAPLPQALPPADLKKAGDAASKPKGKEDLFDEVVAWVNDDIVRFSDLREAEQAGVAQIMQEGRLSPDELNAKIAEVRAGTLFGLIANRLLVQEAEKFYSLEEMKKDLVKRFKERQKIKTDEELDRQLTQWGLSRAELEDKLVLGAAPDSVIDLRINRNLSVSEAEAKKYYEDHRDQFSNPGQVAFRELVLLSNAPEARAGRKAEAVNIASRAKAGEDFIGLVKSYSEAPSRGIEGKIGPLRTSDLLPEIAKALTALGPGAVSDPVETSQGWHILQLISRQDPEVRTFEAVKGECEQAVRQAKFTPAYDALLKQIWKDSTIEVRKPYLDRLPPEWREMATPKD